MTKLNLTAKDSQQKIILKHLTPLVSDVLAEKINNGVRITLDGKELLNKKDLDTFMEYLFEQAKKTIPEKERHGKKCVGMEGEDILNLAIHYFEEDSIHGKLFNLDGTEYAPPKPVIKPTAKAVTQIPLKTQPKPQISIDDILKGNVAVGNTEKPITPVIVEQPKPEQKKGSPMYQHYLSVKEKYKDCIVFYRLGDFYEMFEGDAITTANALDLTLTSRDCGLDERVPMTGIPYHAADAYISKLVEKGYKVAICEQLDGKSERTVERVITQNPEGKQLVDIETGEILQDDNEEMSVEEMQKFDGDIDEPAEVPTISKILAGVEIPDEPEEQPEPSGQNEPDDDFDLNKERERLKAFDRNALVILADILGDTFTLE